MTAVPESFARLGRRLRLGMVGGGAGSLIGPVHRMAARLDDRYELVAGALSSDPERAAASAAEMGIAPDRHYSDFAEMATAEAARDDGIDVVAIVTPNHLHYQPACAFLEKGIDVVCDKPLANTLDECVDLVRRVRASGRVFALTHAYAGYPLVRHARERIAAGDLGEVRVVQVEYPQQSYAALTEDGAGGLGRLAPRSGADRAGRLHRRHRNPRPSPGRLRHRAEPERAVRRPLDLRPRRPGRR